MAKRSKRRRTVRHDASPLGPSRESRSWMRFSVMGLPLLLAAVAFVVYGPSLKSDFVYDARPEILQEGFIGDLSNLPEVLSLKTLGMNLILGSRPGQIFYLMLIAAIGGKDPWIFHLCSNLLHAANVALLFVLLRRLIATETTVPDQKGLLKAQLAALAGTLIFALHPIAVEAVSAVNYSSDLLVTFFTLSALLAATVFRPVNFRAALMTGAIGTFCSFAAVASKESGIAAAGLLIVYWFLFRRREAKLPWLLFLAASTAVSVAFLAARFAFALAPPSDLHLSYLGGSFFQVFLIQPQLWDFMMGQLLWPAHLSADYTLENLPGLPVPGTLAILVVVIALQVWLARQSRTGALGAAIYWLGLATVSNFTPLNRILADRFYYLPLAGVAMQLVALLLMALRWRAGFWLALLPCFVALVPLTALTLAREDVFASDFSLWSDTVKVSPFSSAAHNGLGLALFHRGQPDAAISEFSKALEIYPDWFQTDDNLGVVFLQQGQPDKAAAYFEKAIASYPNLFDAESNLGVIRLRQGRVDEAIARFSRASEINPHYAVAHANLGYALLLKGQLKESMIESQKALDINPNFVDARNNLAKAQALMRQDTGPK
jgi:tetratricopeptide (TPR) repeat protein